VPRMDPRLAPKSIAALFPLAALALLAGCSADAAPPSSPIGSSGSSAGVASGGSGSSSGNGSGVSGATGTSGNGSGATGTSGNGSGVTGTSGNGSGASGVTGTSGNGSGASGATGTSGNGSGATGTSGNGSGVTGTSGNGSGVSGATSGQALDASTSSNNTAGDAAAGCPGVPIVPDATGFVASGSNSVGIHGSWFVYSDCTDLKGKNCAMVTTPSSTTSFPNVGGAMCTSGTTSMATGAWGAGIALELNDGPPQMPFDTVAAHMTGVCFQLTGKTIPTTTVRVAFPTKDNNDNAYFEAVSSVGQHSVLFSKIAQGSWVTSPQSFEPSAVMLMQFQIPSSTTASIPWDFCVEGLTAITQ
jgi:hypothetical protein